MNHKATNSRNFSHKSQLSILIKLTNINKKPITNLKGIPVTSSISFYLKYIPTEKQAFE